MAETFRVPSPMSKILARSLDASHLRRGTSEEAEAPRHLTHHGEVIDSAMRARTHDNGSKPL